MTYREALLLGAQKAGASPELLEQLEASAQGPEAEATVPPNEEADLVADAQLWIAGTVLIWFEAANNRLGDAAVNRLLCLDVKALGNSFPVPVIHWIGRRIASLKP